MTIKERHMKFKAKDEVKIIKQPSSCALRVNRLCSCCFNQTGTVLEVFPTGGIGVTFISATDHRHMTCRSFTEDCLKLISRKINEEIIYND